MGKQFTAWRWAWLFIWNWIEHKGNQGLSGQISTVTVFSRWQLPFCAEMQQ
jgi:hypothetical protein